MAACQHALTGSTRYRDFLMLLKPEEEKYSSPYFHFHLFLAPFHRIVLSVDDSSRSSKNEVSV